MLLTSDILGMPSAYINTVVEAVTLLLQTLSDCARLLRFSSQAAQVLVAEGANLYRTEDSGHINHKTALYNQSGHIVNESVHGNLNKS